MLLSSLLFMEVGALFSVACPRSHRTEVAPGQGNTKTKTLHLLRRNLGANDIDTTIREFSNFYIELS